MIDMTKKINKIQCVRCNAITYKRKRIATVCGACGCKNFVELQTDKYQCGGCGQFYKYGVACPICCQ